MLSTPRWTFHQAADFSNTVQFQKKSYQAYCFVRQKKPAGVCKRAAAWANNVGEKKAQFSLWYFCQLLTTSKRWWFSFIVGRRELILTAVINFHLSILLELPGFPSVLDEALSILSMPCLFVLSTPAGSCGIGPIRDHTNMPLQLPVIAFMWFQVPVYRLYCYFAGDGRRLADRFQYDLGIY